MMSTKRAVVVVRKGRARKIAERYPSGDVKRRERGDPRDLGIYNRCKEARSRFWQDRVLESEIGRLHQVQKVISAGEAEALFELARHLGRYQRLLGFARPVVRSAAFDLGYSGPSDYIVPADLERHARIEKRLHERIRDVVPNETAWDLLHALCAENRHVNPVHAADIARLARAVATVFASRNTLGRLRKATPKPKRSPAQRAAMLVSMLEDYFAECGQHVEAWSLLEGGESAAERGLIGYGAGGFQHSVTMHRGDALAAEFDMAIIRAADAKGWRERA
jgi:hypothetical protein